MIYPKVSGLRMSALGLFTLSQLTPAVLQAETFDTLTVTGNRMPTTELLAPSSVVTRAEIDRLQIDDLPTLLSRQPGIDITNSGGVGQQSSIFMRGTESDHTLVLVNGVKWYSATAGTPAIQDFPVSQIERIEIVRGPRSGLYGSEAIGGVINIITRQGSNEVKPYFNAGIGSDATQKAQAGIRGGDDNTRFSVNLGHYHTEGIDALKTADPDDDGYRNKNISARVSQQVNEDLQLNASFLRAESRVEYDIASRPEADPRNENLQQVMQIGGHYQATDSWAVEMQLAESRDKSRTEYNRQKNAEFNTRYRQLDIKNTFRLGDSQWLNAGFEYASDHVDSTTEFKEDSRDNRALYLSWAGQHERHHWLLSGRHDDNEAYGHYNSGSAEWGYQLTENLQWVANAATAFKAPNFNDLYFPDSIFGPSSNPELEPEKSRTFSVGFRGNHEWGQWGFNAYHTEIRDLIVFEDIPRNVNEARIQGVEFDLNTELAGWDLGLNLALLDPEDRETDERLIRRARKIANISADKNAGRWSYGASWKLNGDRRDLAFNSQTFQTEEQILGGHGIVDLRLAYQIDPDWTVRLNANNILDKEYETVYNYNSLDRQVMLSVSYQP